jgi:hypothetical protein
VTFLLAEDAGLRNVLQGITVGDQKSSNENTPRQVGVWFGQPDQEIRAQNYPYITIDMVDIQRDAQREMRGTASPDYLRPSGLSDNQDFQINKPIPVNIDYQITSYARNPRHDRQLLAQLLYSKLPFRFGSLSLDDGTIRRLDVMDVSKRDVTEQAKRLFVNAITVRVSSEIAQDLYQTILYKVESVHLHNPTTLRAGGTLRSPHFVGIGESTITQ